MASLVDFSTDRSETVVRQIPTKIFQASRELLLYIKGVMLLTCQGCIPYMHGYTIVGHRESKMTDSKKIGHLCHPCYKVPIV